MIARQLDLESAMADSINKPRRRPRYAGKNPRTFAEKYKEQAPERYADEIQKVLASGKTPAGSHRPIMVDKVVEILDPKAGEICTLLSMLVSE
jgi:16S rRNA (cytosine1402-N4)-methyltransferase